MRMGRTGWLPGVVCLASLGLLSACHRTSPPVEGTGTTPGAAVDPSVPPGGEKPSGEKKLTRGGVPPAANDTLVLYYPNDPDTVNPITGSDTVSESFQRWVYEGLADRKYSNPDEFEPSLAEAWEFDEQKLEFTIHLRKGVKWHPMRLPDGTALPEEEFTARDVQFTFDCILNKHIDAASQRSYYEDPDAKDESERYKIRISTVDDYTVLAKWTKPYFLAKEFTLGIPIIPRHVYSLDAKGEPISLDFGSKEFADGFNNHWANRKMCGTGPMIFDDWQKDLKLTLRRNEKYWGEPFYFSQVLFRNISNPNTAAQELMESNIDFGTMAEKDRWLQCRDQPSVKAGKVKLVDYVYPGYRYIGYNFKRDFLKDQRVRLALSHATPVKQIIDEVFKGLAAQTTGPFLPGSTAYDSSLPPIPYDLEKAKALLDEAGWKDLDSDGVRDKKDPVSGETKRASFDLMFYSDAPSYLTIAEIIKENCRQIGVDVQLSPVKWALMLQKLRKKDFDAAMLGWALSWKSDPFQIFHGSQADVPESSNAFGYQNAELDRLIERLRVTLDDSEQVGLYHQMHRLIYQDQPYTFLFQDKATAAVDARLQNIHFYKIRPSIDAREWTAVRPRLLGN